jgi:hypothetical protein
LILCLSVGFKGHRSAPSLGYKTPPHSFDNSDLAGEFNKIAYIPCFNNGKLDFMVQNTFSGCCRLKVVDWHHSWP